MLLVAKLWAGLVEEIKKRLLQMRSDLHSEFKNMRYEKGADLREQFDMGCILSNDSIPVSDDDYRSLVINFVPTELPSFLGTDLALDAESLMKIAAEEWDRREAELKSVSIGTEEDITTDTALAMLPDETRGKNAENTGIAGLRA